MSRYNANLSHRTLSRDSISNILEDSFVDV